MDHWKAELNSSVFRRVLNDPSESTSRVFEFRLFQTVGLARKNKSCVWLPQTSEEESEEDVVPQTSGSVMACNCPGDCRDRKALWRISR